MVPTPGQPYDIYEECRRGSTPLRLETYGGLPCLFLRGGMDLEGFVDILGQYNTLLILALWNKSTTFSTFHS